MDSCGHFFCALKYGSQFFWLYRKVKRGMLNAKRKITIKSGREEIQMEVTEEEYQKFTGHGGSRKEGTEEPGGYGGAGIQDGVL